MNEKTIELVDFIEILGLKTEDEGQALWAVIANREVYLDGVYVVTGSFRWNGGQIARKLGGNYLTYYCGSGSHEAQERIVELFMNHLVTTTDVEDVDDFIL